ncbi:hypoxanthine phosphoribosyltransferase [Wenyingzhuangia fucanilytica]|uniref:Hypoxanthine phosphoribosyltransferase n=1 Tax=Wenyingzhuangia fucanilytica TaxID=1790137 RepID=A0A1B1Y8L5_9FLAO|nr:hypoxanthine phosphoribosyltransferase [Wenyingzhuangia fucanilytica]ANW97121.1 hypoxanthine phosphoribosyltransferase [Wenyingzhuangia fucanilytica]
MLQIHDKVFEPYITKQKLSNAVESIANKIALDCKNETPLFLGVLNGSFMFCSDLLKAYKTPCEISFIKLASYQQTKSTGKVNQLIGLNEDLTNRTVIVVEDIIDTGNTLEKIVALLKQTSAKEVKIATLFLKPTVYNKDIKIDYTGLEIPNRFILGYGMDYDGLGRNLDEVYVLKD